MVEKKRQDWDETEPAWQAFFNSSMLARMAGSASCTEMLANREALPKVYHVGDPQCLSVLMITSILVPDTSNISVT